MKLDGKLTEIGMVADGIIFLPGACRGATAPCTSSTAMAAGQR